MHPAPSGGGDQLGAFFTYQVGLASRNRATITPGLHLGRNATASRLKDSGLSLSALLV
jgi:hypothetical protein